MTVTVYYQYRLLFNVRLISGPSSDFGSQNWPSYLSADHNVAVGDNHDGRCSSPLYGKVEGVDFA